MATPFVSEATAAKIKAIRLRGFATALAVGDAVDLLLWRDNEEDGTAAQIGPQRVLRVMAGRQPQERNTRATALLGVDGEFRKAVPFDVKRGDRFVLPDGLAGRIEVPPLDEGGIVRAGFRLEA